MLRFSDEGLDWLIPAQEVQPNQNEIPREPGEVPNDNKVPQRAAGGRVDPKNIDHDPSEAQKEAGNYRKDTIHVHGLSIAIENARGSKRKGVGKDGKPWAVTMPATYGYLKRSVGADQDHIDVYLGTHIKSTMVFIIDQIDADSKEFDEHKVFLGAGSKTQAVNLYKKAFSDSKGHQRIGAIHEMPIAAFKEWLRFGDTTAPFKKIDRSAFDYTDKSPNKEHCEICKYGSAHSCGLFRMLNQRVPEAFDLDVKINPKGRCNCFQLKEV